MALRRLLVALVAGCALPVTAPAGAWDADYGRAWRGDGVLERGCHVYAFRYRVRPGRHDWGAEFFLVGPGREGLGTDVKLSNTDRKRGRGSFEVCRSATRPGKFRIRGKLTINHEAQVFPPTEESREVHWVKPARFRLRRA
jgi:hypothetical protein